MSRLEMTYEEALWCLGARGLFAIKPGLARIEALIDLLDHPERTYPVIHIAGTNGKSSTARMIGAILAAHGIAAGVYTSPHLQTVRERFLLLGPNQAGVAGDYISPDDFAAIAGYLEPYIEQVETERGEEVTYFEMTTAMAFEWMAEASAGAGVYETGMGGTWDATNVVRSEVAVITHIALDHVKYLGDTPVEIAREKAGIIKQGAVISARQDSDVLSVLESTAAERGCDMRVLDRDFHLKADGLGIDGRVVTVEGLHSTYEDVFVALHGSHQSINASVAIAACETFLGRALHEASLRTALAAVTSPGRMEVVRRRPLVILDGAHNPDGASALASALAQTFGNRPTTFVIAISKDKDIEGILEFLLPLADRAIFTASSEKPADPDLIAEAAEKSVAEIEVVPEIPKAIDAAIARSGSKDMVVVTGSLYAIGAARDHLLGPVR